jgi:hypothetical protein
MPGPPPVSNGLFIFNYLWNTHSNFRGDLVAAATNAGNIPPAIFATTVVSWMLLE